MKFDKLVKSVTEATGPAQMPLTDTEEAWLKDNDWEMLIRGRWQKIIDPEVHRVYRGPDDILKHEISDTKTQKITTNDISKIEDLPQ